MPENDQNQQRQRPVPKPRRLTLGGSPFLTDKDRQEAQIMVPRANGNTGPEKQMDNKGVSANGQKSGLQQRQQPIRKAFRNGTAPSFSPAMAQRRVVKCAPIRTQQKPSTAPAMNIAPTRVQQGRRHPSALSSNNLVLKKESRDSASTNGRIEDKKKLQPLSKCDQISHQNAEKTPLFVHSWPATCKMQREHPQNNHLSRELLRSCEEGGESEETALISSWLAGTWAEGADQEERRPRFSLDHLVPQALISPTDSSASSSVIASFSLRRNSARACCQGTVFMDGESEEAKCDIVRTPKMPSSCPISPSPSCDRIGKEQQSVSPRQRSVVTLLERIVKAHPVWFLPHLDRSEVAHLLSAQPIGVFIVRASSRGLMYASSPANDGSPPSKRVSRTDVMALSVRVAPSPDSGDEGPPELDHYLIEAAGSGAAVRLEKSPLVFDNLPLLLEHYCLRGEEELKTRLALPKAIALADSIQKLQGIALMGQDFWMSSLCLSPSRQQQQHRRQSCSSSSVSTLCAQSPHHLPQQMSTFGHGGPSANSRQVPSSQLPPNSYRQPACSSPSSNCSFYCSSSNYSSMEHFPSSQQRNDLPCCCRPNPSTFLQYNQQQPIYYSPHAPLRKSQSMQSRFYAANGPISALPMGSTQSLREGRLPNQRRGEGGGSGFLRSLFSPSPSRRRKPNHNNNGTLWEEVECSSEYPLEETHRKNSSCSVPVNNGNGRSIFARLKTNFKRTNSASMAPKSDRDDFNEMFQMRPDVIQARQMAFRRTNTDLTGTIIANALGRMNCAPLMYSQQQHHFVDQSPREPPQVTNFPLARVLPQPRTVPTNGRMRVEINGGAKLVERNLKEEVYNNNSDTTPTDSDQRFVSKSEPMPTVQQHLNLNSSSQKKKSINNNLSLDVDCHDKLAKGNGQQHRRSESVNHSVSSRTGTAVAAIRPFPHPRAALAHQQENGQINCVHASPAMEDLTRSEYTQINELPLGNRRTSVRQNETELFLKKNEDDAISVAGTDFNEPWDSMAWDNLLDLAHFGDGDGKALLNGNEEQNENSLQNRDIVVSDENLNLMEKAAKMASSSRNAASNFPHLKQETHRRSAIRMRGTGSLMDVSRSSQDTTAPMSPMRKMTNGKDGSNNRMKGEERLRSALPSQHQQSNHQNPLSPGCSISSNVVVSSRSNSICASITPVFSPSRLRDAAQNNPSEEDPARVIQRYVEILSTDDQTVFGATLQRFIECTLLSKEQDPFVVVRRVRQFLDGIKNYLVKNGEADLHAIIERESDRLHEDEFLNIDAILEAVLNRILLVRIKAQLYRLMILESTRNGELGNLSENLALVRSMSSAELGFPEGTPMPDTAKMEQIGKQLRKMQNHYSPLRKLQLLLRTLSIAIPFIHHSTSKQSIQNGSSCCVSTKPSTSNQSSGTTSSSYSLTAAALKHPPAEELIRWLVYLLARSSIINCEIEAWYMWELLPQQVLSTGDASYFLSILFSAVHVLKHPESIRRLKNVVLPATSTGGRDYPLFADFMGSQTTMHEGEDTSDLLLRVAIPNEQEGTIEYHTFPVLPKMNSSKLCRVIAHQFSVSNPEDYGLYVLFDGYETCLSPQEFPHLIRDQLRETGKLHLFAYKRSDARIAWPRQAVSSSSSVGGVGSPAGKKRTSR